MIPVPSFLLVKARRERGQIVHFDANYVYVLVEKRNT